jgi:hypothetical protein
MSKSFSRRNRLIARQFIASLVTAKALGLINHRWSDAFIELVGKMR